MILSSALADPAVRDALQSFFALLSLALLAGTLLVLAARLLYGRVPAATAVVEGFRPFALPLAAAVTATCTLGSLYFSEIANYTPCVLCWYQRTMMYPLGILLTVFAVARRRGAGWVAVPLGLVGIVVSAYHFLIERMPDLHSPMCSTEVPCNVVWFAEFGFVSLAFMAFTGFHAAIVFTTLPAEPA